ncbi:MAG: beta-lactamase family protein [Acidobacteriota bacterium]|nr:MAG: beta-lactamase family protein [Acidobacteriota bacterium]
MKHLRKFPVCLLLLFVLIVPAAAQMAVRIEERVPEIEKKIQAVMESNSIPGAGIAIARDGRLVYSKGFGFADLENRVPFTSQTVSRIGSISKTFTALAVMQLAEAGKIDIDAEVQTYLPGFPKKSSPITVRQVLAHLSGIRHYRGDEFSSIKHYDDVESSLAIFKDDPLLHEPGEKYTYTTYGYNLLSRIVEQASGEKFGDYLQKHIFDRADLKNTYLDEPALLIPLRARYYTMNGEKLLRNASPVDQSNKWGGGGLLSTVEDLIKYAAAYDTSVLARPETVKRMFTSQMTRSGQPVDYGLGWRVYTDAGGLRIEHSGGSMGATSLLARLPERGLTVAVLVNCDHYRAPALGNEIIRMLIETQTEVQDKGK